MTMLPYSSTNLMVVPGYGNTVSAKMTTSVSGFGWAVGRTSTRSYRSASGLLLNFAYSSGVSIVSLSGGVNGFISH